MTGNWRLTAATLALTLGTTPTQAATIYQNVAGFDEAGLGEHYFRRFSDEDTTLGTIYGDLVYHKLYNLFDVTADSTIESFKLVLDYDYLSVGSFVRISVLALNGDSLPTGAPLFTEIVGLSDPTLIPLSGFSSPYLFSLDTSDFTLTAGSYALGFSGVANGSFDFVIPMWTGADQSIQIISFTDGSTYNVEYLADPVRGVAFAIEGTEIVPSAPVPEPASWAMMIAGFGAVGAAMRRRRIGGALDPMRMIPVH